MKNALHEEFEKLFKELKPSDTLLMTTFGLDEVVLFSLLNKYEVNPRQKIVVAHDIVRRDRPNYIKSKYSNVTIVTVNLKGSEVKSPVFHVKIWGIQRNNKFHKLAIHSINLTATHLGENSNSLESWICLDDVSYEGDGIISKILGSKDSVLNVAATSLYIDGTKKNRRKISETRDPLHKILNSQNFGVASAIVSPFIFKMARKNIGGDKVCLYSTNGQTLFLHSKLYVYENIICTGSMNCTSQALGLNRSMAVNTEIIVWVRNSESLGILKTLKNHRLPIPDDDLDNEPSDLDQGDFSNWEQRRKMAVSAPDKAVLAIKKSSNNKIRNDVVIELIGLKGNDFDTIEISCIDGNKESISISAFNIEKRDCRISILNELDKLASFFESLPIIIRGIVGEPGKLVWQKELDLGEFWKIVDVNIDIKNAAGGGGKPKPGNKMEKKDLVSHQCLDVRVARDFVSSRYTELVRDKGLSQDLARLLTSSWARLRFNNQDVPEWCFTIADEILREGDN